MNTFKMKPYDVAHFKAIVAKLVKLGYKLTDASKRVIEVGDSGYDDLSYRRYIYVVNGVIKLDNKSASYETSDYPELKLDDLYKPYAWVAKKIRKAIKLTAEQDASMDKIQAKQDAESFVELPRDTLMINAQLTTIIDYLHDILDDMRSR